MASTPYIVDEITGSKVLPQHTTVQIIPDRSTAPVTVTVNAVSNESAQLGLGIYDIVSTTACHYIQGATGGTATTSHHFLPANHRDYIVVTNTTTKGYVQVIQNASGGTLYLGRLTSRS